MQQLVNQVYKPKQLDKLKVVSRFEFEQRDVRHKLDMADVYLQLEQITKALEGQGLDLEEIPNRDDVLIQMVKEDRKSTEIDLMDLEYSRRQNSLKNGSLVEKARSFIFGSPMTAKERLAAKELKVTVEPSEEQNKLMEELHAAVAKLTQKSSKETENPKSEEFVSPVE